MNLIRKIKISAILNQSLKGRDKEIVDFIISKISNLTKFTHKEFPKSIFYMNSDGIRVLEFEKHKNKYLLFVRFTDFWFVLSQKYLMRNKDIEDVVHYLIKQHFDYDVKKIFEGLKATTGSVEKEYRKLK